MKLYPPKKIYVAQSIIHGYGVFANEFIKQGEIIEETPLLDLRIEKGQSSPLMVDYRFNWPQGSGGEWNKQVLAWGYGSIYNHSDTANAYWISNLERNTFEFIASRDINKDEEIFVYYGGVSYWQDGRSNVNVV